MDKARYRAKGPGAAPVRRVGHLDGWPLWVLRAISVFYLYGAIVHAANLAGLSQPAEVAEVPAHWVAGDVVYLVLDLAVVAGVWTRRRWGVAAFLVAALSQVALYTLVPGAFALTAEHRAALRWLVGFHAVCLAVYGASAWLAAPPRQKPPT